MVLHRTHARPSHPKQLLDDFCDDTGADTVEDPGVDGSDSKGEFSSCSCASTNAGGGGLLAGLLAGVVLIGRRRRA